jgi:hypothetical protein
MSKQNSDSSPNASSNAYHISYHLTSYTTFPSMIPTQNGRTGTDPSPLTSDIEDIISTFLASLLN